MFDPAQTGSFVLDQPPLPWVDLGWIQGFARKSGSKIEPVRSGAPATTQLQVRTEIDATVAFSFETWGKLQLALASGSQSLNLLATQSGVAGSGIGWSGAGGCEPPCGFDSDRVADECGGCCRVFGRADRRS